LLSKIVTLKRAAFVVSALSLALAPGAFAQAAGPRTGTAPAVSQTQMLPAVPPRLSRPKTRYFATISRNGNYVAAPPPTYTCENQGADRAVANVEQ
jgi:hypothetical protein